MICFCLASLKTLVTLTNPWQGRLRGLAVVVLGARRLTSIAKQLADKSTDTEVVSSPIENLYQFVLAAPFSAAPAKAKELFQLLEQRRVQFSYVDDPGFVFEAGSTSEEGLIRASVPTLELLWAAAYSYWEMYQLITAVQRRPDRRRMRTEFNRRVEMEDLYGWALANVARGAGEEWPPQLPLPSLSYERGSAVHVATELFLVAVAWILHHEVGHIVFRHSDEKSRSVRAHEWEADERATSWLFDGVEDIAIRQKLGLGLVVALAMLAARRKPGEHSTAPEDHPHPLERLPHALAAIGAGDNDVVYAFAIAALQMNMILTNYTYVPVSDASFRIQLEDLCMVLRSHHSRHWISMPTDRLPVYWTASLYPPGEQEISTAAYQLWLKRGRPTDSPDADWFVAERLLNDFLARRRAGVGWP